MHRYYGGIQQVVAFICCTILVFSCAKEVPDIVEKAIQFSKGLANNDPSLASQAADGEVSSLYKIANIWLEDSSSQNDAYRLLHYLADERSHILSMAKLGNIYSERDDKAIQALHYFKRAGEEGPHHSSLYNTGHMLAQGNNHNAGKPDWVGALAYLKAAATLESWNPTYAKESITRVSKEAYEIVSRQISTVELTLQEAADVFLYASLHDLPDDAEAFWTDAVMAMVSFNQTFVASGGSNQDANAMIKASTALHNIWENYSSILTSLQSYLVLDNINDMLGPLSGLDDAYTPMAAGYAEALALSPYCTEQYAVTESDPSCFNGAAASAVSYYRRVQDGDSAQRILQLARSHPHAATHWDSTRQTPRVYRPALKSQPWWNPQDFSAAVTMMELYRKKKKVLGKELEAVKKLQEGRLRGVEVRADGESSPSFEQGADDAAALQRIFTPYIGVRTDDGATSTEGAGGWAEFGPLFNGIEWHEENCKIVPSICKALQNDKSLCTSRTLEKHGNDGENTVTTTTVQELCGSDTVVTMLRLRPGAHILPHCGTTNSRLIMHVPLVGATGVEFTVGEQTIKNYGGGDGSAIVFDDSFEHSVYHGGDEDRFVVLAVLAHPELS